MCQVLSSPAPPATSLATGGSTPACSAANLRAWERSGQCNSQTSFYFSPVLSLMISLLASHNVVTDVMLSLKLLLIRVREGEEGGNMEHDLPLVEHLVH